MASKEIILFANKISHLRRVKGHLMLQILDNPSLVISFVLRMVLGGLFCWAGVSKFVHTAELGAFLASYSYIPAKIAFLVVRALPAAELTLGIMLILGIWTRVSGVLTLLLLVLFTGWALARKIKKDRLPCGCFGGWSKPSDNRLIIVRNCSLIIAAAIVILA